MEEELVRFQQSSDQVKIWPNQLSRHRQEALILEATKLNMYAMILKEGRYSRKIPTVLVQKHPFDEKQLNYQLQDTFCTYTQIHIDPHLPKREFEQQLQRLAPYVPSATTYSLFCQEIENMQGIVRWKEYAREVQKKALSHLQQQPEYKEFVEMKIPAVFPLNATLYHRNNHKRWFLSLDLKQSNFAVTKRYFPKLFPSTWEAFLSSFTESKFLLGSKKFRGMFFGSTGLDYKTTQLAWLLLQQGLDVIHQYLASEGWGLFSNLQDEALYCKDVWEESKCVDKAKEELERKYPNTYHLRLFQLVQIQNTHSYFVKEYQDGKREIKNCPPQHLFTCMEAYESNTKFQHTDLRFQR